VVETEEAESCFFCGVETTALIKDDAGDWTCGRCFIFSWCMSCGPNDYDEKFVEDMRRGLEEFIRILKHKEGEGSG